MRPIREICAEVDQALAGVGMTMTHDGYIKRTYAGTLDGMPLRAVLSVFADASTVARFETSDATGYSLSIECDNGLPTRWVMGENVPVLLRAGLTWVAHITDKAPLRADDTEWAARFLADAVKGGFITLAQHATFIEQRPGVMQLQVRRLGATDVPTLRPLMDALLTVSRASQQPPAPRPAKARFSDNRGLVVAAITVAVLGVLTCGGVLTWLLAS